MSTSAELRSTSEGLVTVNEELGDRIDQLGRANSDLRNLVEGMRVPTVFLDSDMRTRSFTPAAKELFCLQDEDRWRLLIDVASCPDQTVIEALVKKVLATGASIEEELEIEGSKASYVLRVLPCNDTQKAMDGVVLAFSDVTRIRQKQMTELRHLQRELRRLMDELQHRVKNTLATVASIVNQTVATKDDRAELVSTLKKRIGALAATHALLTQHDWRDASLKDILATEFEPFEHLERVTLDGPDVRLAPKHALTLTLTLHELATNAAKYGALGASGGRLTVSWSVNEDGAGKRLTIRWEETGTSQPSGAKITEGFGSRLIRNAVVHDLQGQVEHDLTPDGLHCAIMVALP